MLKNNLKHIYASLALLVWIYLMMRAYFIPPVHDEAATFFHYINHQEFIPGKALWDANNHILNTALSICFVKILGISTFTIRLANLIFFPVYAWFIYRIAIQLRQFYLQVLLLLTALTMHGFIEYLAYSRGYGISMALLTGALYYSFLFIKQKNVHLIIPAIIFFVFATLSNLTLQNSTLLFLGVAGIFLCIDSFPRKQRVLGLAYLFGGGLMMLPFIRLSLAMKADGLLYYAVGEDFWTAVIVSFTQMFFGAKNSLLLNLFWIVWFSIFMGLSLMMIPKIKMVWDENKPSLFFPVLFWGSLIAVLSMHYILGVNFPSDRTGMYLILYLVLGGIFLADSIWSKTSAVMVSIPSLFFLVHFPVGANLTHSTYWKNERLPERFWNRVYEESISGNYVDNPTIGGYQIRTLVWAWHNFTHGGKSQNLQYFDYYSGFEDYQVFSPGDYSLHKSAYDSLDTDEISEITLGRRKTFIHTEPYFDTTGISTPENYAGEYFNLFETLQTDSFIDESFLVEADIKLYSLKTPPKIQLVATCNDSTGKVLDHETSSLDWIKKEYRPEDKAITLKLWWHQIPKETTRIVVYLWNINREAYTLQNASLSIKKKIQ